MSQPPPPIGSREDARELDERLLQQRYREITLSTVVFGLLFGAVMNAAITYAGLKIGFTIGGSAIAAVLGFGILRGVLRRGSILEVNITQTIASGVNIPNSGIIFTVPVLMLLGQTIELGSRDYWLLTLACTAGGLLGVVFVVPLRRQMIEIDRLRFPTPTAVAQILKSPGAGTAKSLTLAAGVVLAMLAYAPAGLPAIRSAASLDQLDDLTRRERTTPAQAELTREIAAWIEARQAPPELVEFGRRLLALRDLKQATEGPDATADDAAACAAARQALADNPPPAKYRAALLIALARASAGEKPWESLRNTEYGWAAARLWGYQDLGWRIARTPAGGTALDPRYDRDGNARPDLVMLDDRIDVGRVLGLPPEIQLVFAIAPFALGAGYLTGTAGLTVLAGGVIVLFLLNPIGFHAGLMPGEIKPHAVADFARMTFNRPLGIGLLTGGALMGILASAPAMRAALGGIIATGKRQAAEPVRRDELGVGVLLSVALVSMAVLLLAVELAQSPAGDHTGWLAGLPPMVAKAITVLVAIVWIWFAGIIISQCAGMTDWSPISGMALLTVVLVMMLAGRNDVFAAVLLGAALCVAISAASDMMGDLKTGFLVGAQPRRQACVQILAVSIAPMIAMTTLTLIATVNLRETGVPIGPGTPTEAPQAQTLEAVVRGVQGGDLPYALYGLGGLLGVALGLAAFPSLGVMVGLSMFLPTMHILTYGVGCLLNVLVVRIKGRAWAEEWGMPLCAGLIVGEALLALTFNTIVLARG